MLATLDAQGPSVVVGDRSGNLYAYHLADGSPVAGWPVYDGGSPIDSTPSAAALDGSAFDSVFVGTGDAEHPRTGGYEAYGPGGQLLWHTSVYPPGSRLDGGVQASLTAADLQGGTDVFAGSLGQKAYALNTTSGKKLAGWPFFSADTIYSTAAIGDLYGSGQDEVVVGGASTEGVANGQQYQDGGHVRVISARGQLLYDYDTDQEVDSSPAIGAFLAGGATGIVVGTGHYYAGASDTDKVLAFTTRLVPAWSQTLDGCTESSPALVDVGGQLDVVEGTDLGPANCGGTSAGSVWVLDGADGTPLCHAQVPSRVVGSVVAADLPGGGQPDLLVPTLHGVEVLTDSCQRIAVLRSDLGFQNSALVTDDPNGTIGITIAGYNGNNQGVIDHYEIPGSDGAAIGSGTSPSPGTWPMFHDDTSLGGTSAPMPYLGTLTPTTLAAEPGNAQVDLSWTPPPAAGAEQGVGYDIYEGTAPGEESSTPVNGTPVTGTGYTVTGLSDGTTYYFEVTAVDAAGEGAPIQASATPTSEKLALSSEPPSSVTAGSRFAVDVSVEDAFGNVLTNDSTSVVNLAISPGSGTAGATLSCGSDPVTASNGVASFSCSIDRAGSGYVLQASSSGLGPVTSSPVTVTPGSPSRLVVSTEPPSSITAGSRFSVRLLLEDAYGNVATTDSTSAVNLAISPGRGEARARARLACSADPVTASDGVATFSCSIDQAGSGYRLTATTDTIAPARTVAVRVTRARTKTRLRLSRAAVTYGHEQLVHLSVKVSAPHLVPTGTVTIGGVSCGRIHLSGGTGGCRLGPRSLKPGVHRLVALYHPGTSFQASRSGGARLRVNRARHRHA